MQARGRLLAIAGLVGVAYWGLAPAVVNGDGLGYLKAAARGDFYPGHLGYVPLLRLFAGARPVDALGAARALSVVAGALAALALGAATARLGGAGALAALGLAVSWGPLGVGSDVESYAPALAALVAALWALVRRRDGGWGWTLAATVAVAAATLLHVENLLFVLPLALALPRGEAPFAVAGVALLVAAPYAAAARGWAWLGGASHGFHYPVSWRTPLAALAGASKALVYSPYPYEASWVRVGACFTVGAAALVTLLALARRGGAPLGRAVTLAWALPYALVGVAFFASDAERWLFLLPLVWLSAARAAARDRGARRLAWALVGALAAANAIAWLPVARDDTMRVRAHAAAAHTRAGDLIVSPGHGWDEYIGFYDGPALIPFPLVYYTASLGSRDAVAGLLRWLAQRTRAAGGRVLAARLDDDGDPLGWKELRPLGIDRAAAAALLGGRRTPLGDGIDLVTE